MCVLVDKRCVGWYKEFVWSDLYFEVMFIGSVFLYRGVGVFWGKDVLERFL